MLLPLPGSRDNDVIIDITLNSKKDIVGLDVEIHYKGHYSIKQLFDNYIPHYLRKEIEVSWGNFLKWLKIKQIQK